MGIPSDEFLGTLSVIPITEKIKPLVKKELRGNGDVKDNIVINTVQMAPPETDDLIVTLEKNGEGSIQLMSVYTGIVVPHLPRPEQSKEERKYNAGWWSEHAFVK